MHRWARPQALEEQGSRKLTFRARNSPRSREREMWPGAHQTSITLKDRRRTSRRGVGGGERVEGSAGEGRCNITKGTHARPETCDVRVGRATVVESQRQESIETAG